MPPEFDESAASSAAEEAAHQTNQDVSAESSTADQGANTEGSASPTDGTSDGRDGGSEQEEDLLSVITEAAGDGEDSTDADTDADSEQDQSKSEDSETDADSAASADSEETDENGNKLPPFHKHPRWQEMVRERDTYRTKAEELEPRAQEFDKIDNFMKENELSAQEVADGLQVVAMMKNDPARARDVLAERMESLDQYSGHKLPDDLAREVDEGYISEDRARELARLRNEKDFAEQRRERTEQKSREQLQQEQDQRQREQAQSLIQQQRTAVQDWESKLKAKDPDYGRIQSFVAKELRLQVQQNPPRSVNEAIQLADKAYNSVKAEFKKAMPERPAVRRSPGSDQSGASSATDQQPGSFMDVVQQAADQS